MKLKLLFLLLMIFQISYSQIAKIQFIHNAPDISITEVDVYVDDILVVDNLAFKTGSAFLDVPFDGNMAQISITNSTDESDVFVSRERMLIDQENYYVVLNGVFNADGYVDAEPFDLFLYEGARLEAEEIDEGIDLDVIVQHGAMGFDNTLTVEGCQILAAPISFASPVDFSEFSGYSHWVSNDDIGCVARESYSVPQYFYFPYRFPLSSENLGLEGQAIMMLLSGFRNPEDNNDGEPFNTWYLTAEGGDFVLLSEDKIANIQFVHNAPDASIEEVDVFANGMLVADNLSFKTGTSFIPVVLDESDGVTISIRDVVTGGFLHNDYLPFADQENYYLVMDGILDTDAYTDVEPFGVHVYEGAQLEASDPDSELDLDIMVHHGAIGFDHTLDVQGTQILAAPLRLGRLLSFSDYSDDNDFTYSVWSSQVGIGIEIGDYGGNIGGDLLSDFEFNFSFELPSESVDLENQAILMLLSGFQDPQVNNDGQPFDVFYLTPEGGEFRSATLGVDDSELSAIAVYPNPVQDILTIKTLSPNVTGVIYDMQGKLIYKDISIQNTATIDVSELKSGIYFLQLTDQKNNASTVRRIIKN
ncbi:MAG: hypothetical protein ACI9Y7_002297 [Dokdonia sp.]|jgi:hypothetical protein